MDIDKLFEFQECDNGYILSNFRSEDDPSVTEVEIPSEYKGKPVINIGYNAFSWADHLRKVVIPEGVTKIESCAFEYCENLETVILPDSLKVIGDNAFFSCAVLDNITFPKGLEKIEEDAFLSCERLSSIVLPDSLKRLEKYAFSCCLELTSVVLSNGLTEISEHLFESCGDLGAIVLPDSIRRIGKFAFSESDLTSINFSFGLENIEEGAFCDCYLSSVTFPPTLKKIGQKAFSNCRFLEKVDFGESAPLLEAGVFDNCPKLGAENIVQGLACSADISQPFQPYEDFDWDTALREDVFALAMKYNSFALFDKDEILLEIVRHGITEYLPLAESTDRTFTGECAEKALSISSEKGLVEMTAWLLDYKNRKIGFENEKNGY